MRAAVRSTYGPPDVLSVKDVDVPTPDHDEALVKVHAATVNRSDCHVLTGKPFFMRFATGLWKPSLSTTGSDFAGEIITVGKDVRSFSVGDKVMGFMDMGAQSHAEYLTIAEKKLTYMPVNVTYQQAVACLEGAFYAISGIQRVKPKAGQTALVIGGTGAIGSSFVQFLRYYNVDVTAVCPGENAELVKSLGARRIIDFRKEDFTQTNEQYDLILDGVGKYTFRQCLHLLKANGIFSSSQPNVFNSLISSFKRNGKREVFPIPKDLMPNLNFIRT